MSERFTWTEPKLCSYECNISKDWFVYFTCTDHLTGETVRKQFRGGINSFKKKEDRLLQGNALKSYWKQQLKAGWTAFSKTVIPISKPIITDAFDHILKLKANSCGTRTIQTYTYVLKLLKGWLAENKLNNIFLCQFDQLQAQTYMDHLQLQKGYSGRTYNDHLTVLSTFINCMIGRDWIDKNPFRKIKKLQVEIGRNIAFSDAEKLKLKDHLQEHDLQMYYFSQFIYYCFIRRSELTRLKIENIDWKNMSIIIPSNTSKNKKQESVVIPDPFVSLLKEMNLKYLPGDWFIFGRRLVPGPVQYINYNHISDRHNKISRELGINSQKGLYSWKHSGVCALYNVLQGDIYSLMRQLRHSDLATTQIYLKSLGLLENNAVRNALW